MGFGKKTDPSTGKTLDLDKTYKNIIQPTVKGSGLECVRADEIQDSGLIDKSMYALLMHADLVIADISTYNPNAIYELGIRHAVRPYSTIIINEKGGKIPFDLDHTRTFHYSHLGEDIGVDEAERCKNALSGLIESTMKNSAVDSPLYDFIQGIEPPVLPEGELKRIIGDLASEEKHIFAIAEQAKEYMREGNFIEAAKLWGKASEKIPSESFFVQQQALAVYKSKNPSELMALSDGLRIIESLDPDGDTNDPETLGITGAIYKRMWALNNDKASLERAIHYYEKGFKIRNDYYTGENYALCLNIMASIEAAEDEKTYNTVAATKVRKEIIKSLEEIVNDSEEIERADKKWVYATLANCHFGLGNDKIASDYEKTFMGLAGAGWEIATYNESKEQLISLIRR